MTDTKRTKPGDEGADGGGIGTIGRQPIDPTSQNPGQGTPDAPGGGTGGAGLSTDRDATPSDEDPDREADETLGTVV